MGGMASDGHGLSAALVHLQTWPGVDVVLALLPGFACHGEE